QARRILNLLLSPTLSLGGPIAHCPRGRASRWVPPYQHLLSIFATIAASEKSGGNPGRFGRSAMEVPMAQTQLLDRLDAAIAEEDIGCCPALPGTQAVVSTFREICGDRPVAEAVAALYAYESQVPEISATKIDGLKKFYGVDQSEALAYFSVHEEADKAHRA